MQNSKKSGETEKVIWIALLANLGIALAKFLGAFVSGSASLFAEAIHSLVDCANQILLLIGLKKSARPPDSLHPLGYGREAFFWSFIVAIALFSIGGLYAIQEGAHKLASPHEPLNHPALGVGILLFGLVLEGFSFRACLLEIRKQNTYPSLWTWFRRTTSADLLVVFTEDLAALFGLFLATCALCLAWFTGNPTWDAVGSILVGGVLLVVATFLAIEVKSLLIGEAAEIDFRAKLEPLLKSTLPGSSILKLITLQIGSGSVMLSCKFHPGSTEDAKTIINGINLVELEMRKTFPEITWQFFEPDFED